MKNFISCLPRKARRLLFVYAKDERSVNEDTPLEKDGGRGSGNFGHKGRPGQTGGSGAGGGMQGVPTNASRLSERDKKEVKDISAALLAKRPKVSQSDQAKHENAESARQATEAERLLHPHKRILHKSYFTVKMQSIQSKVIDCVKKGDFEARRSIYNDMRLHFKFDSPIGIAYSKRTGEKVRTRQVTLAYSKIKGFHIYPSEEEDEP